MLITCEKENENGYMNEKEVKDKENDKDKREGDIKEENNV